MNIQLKNVLADMADLENRLKRDIRQIEKDFGKAQHKLKTFKLLAQDLKFGRYYLGHVKAERASIRRLQQHKIRCKSRLLEIEKHISALRRSA